MTGCSEYGNEYSPDLRKIKFYLFIEYHFLNRNEHEVKTTYRSYLSVKSNFNKIDFWVCSGCKWIRIVLFSCESNNELSGTTKGGH